MIDGSCNMAGVVKTNSPQVADNLNMFLIHTEVKQWM